MTTHTIPADSLCKSLVRYLTNTVEFQYDQCPEFRGRITLLSELRITASCIRTEMALDARKEPRVQPTGRAEEWTLGKLVEAVLRSDAPLDKGLRARIRRTQHICLLLADVGLHTKRNVALISGYGKALQSDIAQMEIE